MTGTEKMTVNLHIDHLVVDELGSRTANARLLAEAVRERLSAMLGAGRLQPQFRENAEHDIVPAGSFSLRTTDRAVTVGQRIAQSVYAAIGEPVQETGRGSYEGRRP